MERATLIYGKYHRKHSESTWESNKPQREAPQETHQSQSDKQQAPNGNTHTSQLKHRVWRLLLVFGAFPFCCLVFRGIISCRLLGCPLFVFGFLWCSFFVCLFVPFLFLLGVMWYSFLMFDWCTFGFVGFLVVFSFWVWRAVFCFCWVSSGICF